MKKFIIGEVYKSKNNWELYVYIGLKNGNIAFKQLSYLKNAYYMIFDWELNVDHAIKYFIHIPKKDGKPIYDDTHGFKMYQ